MTDKMARPGEELTAEQVAERQQRIEAWRKEGKSLAEIAALETAASGRGITRQRIDFLLKRGAPKTAEGRPRKASA